MASKYLNVKKPLTDQNTIKLALVYSKAWRQYPILLTFQHNWAAIDFLKLHLKNTATRKKVSSTLMGIFAVLTEIKT